MNLEDYDENEVNDVDEFLKPITVFLETQTHLKLKKINDFEFYNDQFDRPVVIILNKTVLNKTLQTQLKKKYGENSKIISIQAIQGAKLNASRIETACELILNEFFDRYDMSCKIMYKTIEICNITESIDYSFRVLVRG